MSWLWTCADMIAAMRGRPVGNLPQGISGISIDSRSISRGEAFFAIKGDRVDGHDFAGLAIANGAAMLVVSEGKLPALGRLIAPMIVVDDVLEALGRLACAARDRSGARVIGVTGSVGKTTTKEMLRHSLSACGRVHAADASFNNHWGVPLTLARMPEATDYGIFEIGMNHPGEIRPLTAMVRPHVAVITTIAPAHLGNFRDLDEIATAKAEIMEGLTEGGHLVLNRDIDQFDLLKRKADLLGIGNITTFGESAKADYRLIEYAPSPEGATLWAAIEGRTWEVPLGAPGRHIAENALAVLAAAHLAGGNLERLTAALATMVAEKGRGARHRLAVPGGAITLIDESYNANPTSMRAAIALLAAAEPDAGGRRIAVLGDMLEMGVASAEMHAELAGPLVEAGVDAVYLAGPDMAHLSDALPDPMDVVHRPDVNALLREVLMAVGPGDVVMVKSSKGTGCARIVAALLEKYPPVEKPESAV
ncbi:UDP-N-acetylmuramoylalanyl-D-glutamyl-2, 6-diaminopimelate--D-alanyl-D-alanine ligase [Rhizobium rhizosphaerae]|uniref:UDP-N-acetylmuramoyl-tripeptide--D-alanyl-D-alanine ligase n=1 Tax=Xaviernesmea rhizosphaerae TaxID=1672749 RepID=A0A1Q9AMB4_9HYPH|nr:UDP-N-acetylmuramoylalanyl-D-glutamyl-2,6-diaminopimelate--D-alanyl-D-alanine ligase [Xaviernesmea rhizosphaerae]OLP56528.1 UDP-N-acetylmuramoylalanyl-D-glutamyl-2, 6-diaminopimelate--D-alanyl-D-alanine ligase [Xaviernesmea rhizosphaerae]OQP87831.1 UDP-N-acetylmuramoylalanyl-D-glutamyl-2, 6-diaminopimelate--D-alanyl-D-alanine ligase [Xaviernesmea rhizosphaerae]